MTLDRAPTVAVRRRERRLFSMRGLNVRHGLFPRGKGTDVLCGYPAARSAALHLIGVDAEFMSEAPHAR